MSSKMSVGINKYITYVYPMRGYTYVQYITYLGTLAENGVLFNGVKLVPLYIEVLTRTLCKKPLFGLKVRKNDRFLS